VSTPRQREIACAIIIDAQGRFLLQQRDDVPGILQPGKVGLFGGHRENNETYLQCVVREVHEEISYFVAPNRFEYLASYDGPDFETDGNVRAEFFIARGVPVEPLVVTEGSLLIVEPDKFADVEHRLTPSARFAMRALFEQKSM